MERITIDNLRRLAQRLCELTGNPVTPAQPYENGKPYTTNPGCMYIHQQAGGYCLEQICADGHGSRNVVSCGHIPARELYNRMHAFYAGIVYEREHQQKERN